MPSAQPRTATSRAAHVEARARPARASGRRARRTSSGRSSAAVPITTRATPASSSASAAASSRTPAAGLHRRADRSRRSPRPPAGSPARRCGPRRGRRRGSTARRRRRTTRGLAHRVVAVDGLLVEVALVRRTQRPPRRSMAGYRSITLVRRRSARRSCARMRRPFGRRLLGVELGGPHVVPLDRGDDRAAVVARGDRVGACPRARTSARSTPTAGSDRPVEQRARPLHVEHVPLHLRVLHARRAAARSGRAARRGPATPGRLLDDLVEHLHADADAEERPAVVGRARRATSSSPASRSASMQRPNAPTPGSTTPAASAMRPGSAVRRASAPTRCSAFWAERRLPMP